MNKFFYTLLLFCSYSFIGWIFEVITAYIKEKTFINRGFLFGPFIPIYGFGALAILGTYNIFSKYTNNVIFLVFLAILITSMLELFTGILMEKVFKARWWDYSDMKFNILGHVSLLFSCIWGVFSYALITYVHPLISTVLLQMQSEFVAFVGGIGLMYLIIDTITSVNAVYDYRRIIERHKTLDILINYLKSRPERLSRIKRIYKAFPTFKFTDYPNFTMDIRKMINNGHDRVEKVVKKIKRNHKK